MNPGICIEETSGGLAIPLESSSKRLRQNFLVYLALCKRNHPQERDAMRSLLQRRINNQMKAIGIAANDYLELLGEAASETLWPTRCAICDTPGAPLCARCKRQLPYIDPFFACPTCGAPFGKAACTECNRVTLDHRGLDAWPLDGCRSVCRATKDAIKLVTTYKDHGDQTLAPHLAHLMAQILPPAWRDAQLVPVPARSDAVRRRGFDHVDKLSALLAREARLHRTRALANKGGKDQRALGDKQRLANMTDAFGLVHGARLAPGVILVDDVMTTSATLFAAASVLRQAGAQHVFALTFARV